MKPTKHLLPIALLAIIMLFAFSAAAWADDFEIPPFPQVPGEENTTMEYVASFLLQTAGLKESNLGAYPRDHIAMAENVGLFKGVEFVEGAECGIDDYLKMANNVIPLFNALRLDPPEPFFVNGMAQPIFPYGNSTYYDTSGEGVARFLVYVETDYDTDGDGKLDLIKVMVQLPRAAVEKGMKCASIYHAQPYNEGTNDGVSYPESVRAEGQAWLNENGPYTKEMLLKKVPPRTPAGEITTKELVDSQLESTQPWRDWRYSYSYAGKPATTATVNWGVSNGNQVGSLNMHDYFVVRGYALISTAGIGTLAGEGLSTYGAEIEIAAYKKVIEWLNGEAVAYTDKTSNIQIKADWSNGLAGMTGTSYGGTVPNGVASTGVKGLETIIPVCGIISYYEYQNQQGAANWGAQYTPGMVWYILSSFGRADWVPENPLRARQMGYMQQMYWEAMELNNQYGEHWARRDYTLDGWFEDWGPSKLHASMLIVHGTNDNNVRPKQSVLMYEACKKAGVDVKFIWDQGAHMTPNNHQIGPYVYQEWQNLWYSKYLYKVDNDVLDLLPEVYAQSNLTGDYEGYENWHGENKLILANKDRVVVSPFTPFSYHREYEVPVEYDGEDLYLLGGLPPNDSETKSAPSSADNEAPLPIAFASDEDQFTLINSANGSSSWQNMLDAPTAASTLYSIVLPEDITIKGNVAVNFRAAIMSAGSNVLAENNATTNPTGSSPTGQARVHARLVEIAAPGTTLRTYGGNAVGDSPSTSTVVSGGIYRGGGLSNLNIVRFNATTTTTYREIARGWMNLAHPEAGWVSNTATPDKRLDIAANIGVYHDYTLYLQPCVHTAKQGNRLALIISTGHNSTTAYTGNNAFTFSIDNKASYVAVPLAAPIDTFTVTFLNDGEIHDVQTVDYSNWAAVPVEPEKEGYNFIGWFTKDGEEWDFALGITADLTLFAQWEKIKPEGTVTVNFPGIKEATVQYYTNVSQWVTVGIFDDTGDFIIPEAHKATWGVTTVRVVKDGMYHTFTLDYLGKSVILDVPLATITVTGVASACNLAIVQNDWVYRYASAAVGASSGFLVFDNGKAYELRLQKPGDPIISIKGIIAGQTVDIGSYF